MGPEGPNPRAEALSIEAQLGLGPEGPNPTGRGVEAVPALARGIGFGSVGPNPNREQNPNSLSALANVDFPLGAFPRNLPWGDHPKVRLD